MFQLKWLRSLAGRQEQSFVLPPRYLSKKEKQAVLQHSEGMEKVLLGSPVFGEWDCAVRY